MKKLQFVIVFIAIAGALHAQSVPFQLSKAFNVPLKKWHPQTENPLQFSFLPINQQDTTIDHMPIAANLPTLLIFVGNNQQGFDAYKATPDNMIVLRPDITFTSKMPVIKYTIIQKPVAH